MCHIQLGLLSFVSLFFCESLRKPHCCNSARSLRPYGARPRIDPVTSIVDPHHVNADADPDSDFILCGSGSGSDFSTWCGGSGSGSSSNSWTLKPLALKQAHIPYILACHRQIDADLDPPDPAYRFDADPDPDFYWCGCGSGCGTGSTTLPVTCLTSAQIGELHLTPILIFFLCQCGLIF